MKLGDFLKAINKTKEPLMDEDPFAEKEYVPFVITRTLSYFPDTIFHANEMNFRSWTDKKLHFDYLRSAIRPRSRFTKWEKQEKNDKIDTIKAYYGYNDQRAREVVDILSDEDVMYMKSRMNKGGR